MGLFSSKTTYSVQGATQTLCDIDFDLIRKGVSCSVVDNRPIVEDLLTNISNGLGVKSRAYYRWGRDKYVYGLPSGTMSFPAPDTNQVLTVLREIAGQLVQVDYAYLDLTDPKYFSFEYLDANYGFDFGNSSVINPPAEWGAGENTVYFGNSKILDESQIEIELTWANGGALSLQVATITPMITGETYYYTSYFLVDNNGYVGEDRYYWIYRESSHLYPQLDQPDRIVQSSPYMPIVPIQYDNKVLTDDEDYAKNIRIGLKMIGVDLANLTKSLDENPANNRDRIYILESAHIQDDSPYVMLYLFNYFEYLRQYQLYDNSDYINWQNGFKAYEQEASTYGGRSGGRYKRKSSVPRTPPVNVVTITEDYAYQLSIKWNYIYRETIDGNFGDIGSMRRTNYTSGDYADYTTVAWTSSNSMMFLDKQISETQFDRISISGLQYSNYVLKGESITSSLKNSIQEWEDDNKQQLFCIPLHSKVLEEMGIRDGHYVAQRCVRMQINAWDKQKTKWYQTSFFATFIQIVIIIVAVLLAPATGGASLGLAGIGTFIANMVIATLISIVVTEVATFFVNVVGLEDSLLGDLIIAAAQIYAMSITPTVGPGGLTAAQPLSNAQMILGTTNAVLQVGMKYQARQLNENMLGAQRDMEARQKEMDEWEEQQDELEEGAFYAGMTNNLFTNSATIDSPEGIDMKMARMLDPNPGLKVFDQMDGFFDRAITLPDTTMDKNFQSIYLA